MDIETVEKVDTTDWAHTRFHHHAPRKDVELAIITGYSGPLITSCGRAKEGVGDPSNHPCCPDCAQTLKHPCTASN